MNHDYSELLYDLPALTAVEGAQNAIGVLEDLAKKNPASLFYAIQPSNILALAQLRSLSPYNDFRPGVPTETKQTLEAVLKNQGFNLFFETSDVTDEEVFSIYCPAVFAKLPEQYGFAKQIWEESSSPSNSLNHVTWCRNFEHSLEGLMQDDTLPKDWLKVDGSSQDLRYGIELGYPGQAISSIIWRDAERDSEELQNIVVAPYMSKFVGAEVSYEIDPILIDNDSITSHQALWKDTLEIVYEKFNDTYLQSLPGFWDEYIAYKKYYD